MKHISLNTHVRSDKAKWWLVTLCLIVVGVILCGLMTSWFKDWNPFCWFGHDYGDSGICARCGAEKPAEEPAELEQANSNVIFESTVAQGISLYAMPAPLSDSNAEMTFDLEARIKNASADDKRIDWTIGWSDSNSLWAIGKDVADYATLEPTSEYAQTATVTILQDFGEEIIVTATSVDKPEHFDVGTFNYVQRIKSFTFNMPTVSSTTTSFTYDIEYSNYTIAADISIDVSDKCTLDEDFMSDIFVDAWDEIGTGENYVVCAPLLSKNGNTLTFAPDLAAFEQKVNNLYNDRFYAFEAVSGLVGAFIMYDSQSFDQEDLSDGDLIYMFRYELEYYETPCTFDVTYSATYDGKTYSQGTQTIGVKFDGQALHVPVEGVTLSQNNFIV